MLLEIDKNNESTTTNADNNVYMKYMSDFIIYLYTMEKLIELLKTFEEERVEKLKSDVWGNDTISPRIWSKSDITIYNKLQVISKEFGFIKRLVDNDKIDRDRILKENGQFRLFYYDLERVKNYDRLVMYLSVEDNPIEFLVSILK